MSQGSSPSFTSDQNSNPNSALNLNNGWTQVPSGVYFDTVAFSISVWIYPQNVGSWSRVIDFNGGGGDYIALIISWTTSGSSGSASGPAFEINSDSLRPPISTTWQLLTATFDGLTNSFFSKAYLKLAFGMVIILPRLPVYERIFFKSWYVLKIFFSSLIKIEFLWSNIARNMRNFGSRKAFSIIFFVAFK